jgi:hypothetical protein
MAMMMLMMMVVVVVCRYPGSTNTTWCSSWARARSCSRASATTAATPTATSSGTHPCIPCIPSLWRAPWLTKAWNSGYATGRDRLLMLRLIPFKLAQDPSTLAANWNIVSANWLKRCTRSPPHHCTHTTHTSAHTHARTHTRHTLTTAHTGRCVCAVAAGAHQRGGGQGRSPAAAGQAGRVRAPDRALLRHLLRVRHLARTLHHRTPPPPPPGLHCPTPPPPNARVVWHCRDSMRATTSSSSPSPSLEPSVAVRRLLFVLIIYLFMMCIIYI